MKWARISDGVVFETSTVDPTTIYSPSLAAQFIECPDNVEAGYLYINGIFYPDTTYYCYYDYGMSMKTVNAAYVAADGEKIYSTTQTESELTVDFPANAGSITHTITTNAIAGDTITIEGIILTAGTDFEIGSDITTTATNISTAINSKNDFSLYFLATSVDETITVIEKIAGNKTTPNPVSSSGTIVITSGTAINSVYGYKNGVMSKSLRELTLTYVDKMTSIKRGLLDAYTLSNSDTVAELKTLRESIVSEYKTKAQAIING